MNYIEELISGKLPELSQYCRDENVQAFRATLDAYVRSGKSLRSCNMRGWQAIHECVADQSELKLQCLQMLLNANIDLISERTYENLTPLMIACRAGSTHAVDVLLEANSETLDFMEDVSLHGDNALTCAMSYEGEQSDYIASKLIAKNSSLTFVHPDNMDKKPIHIACLLKKHNILDKLLDCGVPTTACSEQFPPPLSICAEKDWAAGMEMLISKQKKRNSAILNGDKDQSDRPFYLEIHDLITATSGTEADHENSTHSSTPMMIACDKGSLDCVTVLLNEGLSPLDSQTANSLTFCYPLSHAVQVDNRPLVKLLLSYTNPAELDLKSKKILDQQRVASHPLSFLAYQSAELTDQVQFLMEAGFPFNLKYVLADLQETLYHHRLSAKCTLSYITSHCADFTHNHRYILKTIELLLKHGVKITPEAIVSSCWVNNQGSSAHLLLLKYLSKVPFDYVKEVMSAIQIRSGAIVGPKDVLETRSVRIGSSLTPLMTFQFAMKGFRVTDSSKQIPFTNDDPTVFFLNPQEQQAALGRHDNWRKEKILASLIELPATLKALTRCKIRECLGTRLLLEPVTHSFMNLDAAYEADESWEKSVINELPLPNNVKEYLKYTDILEAYSSSMRSSSFVNRKQKS